MVSQIVKSLRESVEEPLEWPRGRLARRRDLLGLDVSADTSSSRAAARDHGSRGATLVYELGQRASRAVVRRDWRAGSCRRGDGHLLMTIVSDCSAIPQPSNHISGAFCCVLRRATRQDERGALSTRATQL